MFKCDLCPRSFGCRSGLVCHLKNSHKVVELDECSTVALFPPPPPPPPPLILCGHVGVRVVWESREDGMPALCMVLCFCFWLVSLTTSSPTDFLPPTSVSPLNPQVIREGREKGQGSRKVGAVRAIGEGQKACELVCHMCLHVDAFFFGGGGGGIWDGYI